MRRSIYNDYRPLRIALLLLLVVLGLLIYMTCSAPCEHVGNGWEVTKEATCTDTGLRHKVCTECETPFGHETIPAKGHTPVAAVTENEVDSTCTVGGSHDEVVYCSTCNAELDRDTVKHDLLPHTPGDVKVEDFVDSKHVAAGSYNDVIRCTECNYIISSVKQTVEPKGHNYTEWSADYDETTGDFVFTGCCEGCDEEGHTIVFTQDDVNDNLKITVKYDDRYSPCCINQYKVELVYTFTYDGKTVTETLSDIVELEPHNHIIHINNSKDTDDQIAPGKADVTMFALYDDLGAYYDIDDPSTKGYFRYDEDAEWSFDGFTTGYFVCVACEQAGCQECESADGFLIEVRLYSAEHDVTKN